jgi:hypothetical protein
MMRVRVIDVEGTAEELASSTELLELLQGGAAETVADIPVSTKPETTDRTSQVPEELRDFIVSRAGAKGRAAIIQRWVDEVMAWSVSYQLGTSKASPDGLNNYLLFYAAGPRHYGAFAYIHPSQTRVTFRLDRTDADGCQHATFRDIKAGTVYEVMVSLSSEEAYQEALQLARKALKRVQEG